MSIDQYLNKVKLLADNLEIAGKPIPHLDLVTQVMASLDEEYTPVVVQINSRDSISWGELQSTLMTFESRLEHLNAVKNEMTEINLNQTSINFTQKPGLNNHQFRVYRPNNGGRFNRGGRRGRYRGGGFNSSDKPICQVCGKIGHKANICNFRYDELYTGRPPNQGSSYNSSPTALAASPSIVSEPAWFADTGANDYVTAEVGNINLASEYTGKEKIVVGNGNRLHISHIGIKHLMTRPVRIILVDSTRVVC
ncbi:Hypothetical predicted protein [Olea europaea subsp. europaea]|uniref:CCHC-type domain-containing protein n=1 Tax=Olea europaea subsp. europaea TaxID=158383 RepID=A0A8S0VGB1_OLEEU|nr:Hypothetical predicted protein [Olea europaea subsp. europaea]